jgi:hypothetical protein
MVMIPFTNNYSDKSTDLGFQFEFFCMHCGNGYESSFQPSATGVGSRLARGVGGLLGGSLWNLGAAAGSVSDMVRGPARDAALQHAVEEMRPLFKQCHRCGQWVCNEICWNAEAGLCVSCAPKMTQELAAAQSEAAVTQMRDKVAQQDWTATLNVTQKAVAICPHCGAEGQGGKFCQECGQPLTPAKTQCAKCGAEMSAGQRFCAECGAPAGA